MYDNPGALESNLPIPVAPVIAESLAEMLAIWPKEITLDNLDQARAVMDQTYPGNIDEHVGSRPFHSREHTISIPQHPSMKISFYRPVECAGRTPALLFIHGGGLIAGHRFSEDLEILDLALDSISSVVSVEYRLAPEHPFPAAIEDCFAAWQWMVENSDELEIDPDRIILVGESAGGGLAAALAILIRDRGGRQPRGQMLVAPMLDHRNNSPSVHQQDGLGPWGKISNRTGWSAYLDALAGARRVPAYASPSSAEALTGLPSAFIDAGDAEIFRDEAVEYARKLWAAGVPAELHVWSGGCHTFYAMIPQMPLARVVYNTRLEWMQHLLSGTAR